MEEFEALLNSGKTAVERWVKAHIGKSADAEDVLQETYLAAFQGFPQLRSREAFLPWILGIARRKCADWYRAQEKSRELLTDTLPEREAPSGDDSAVEETLAALSERDCLMLRLFYQEMLSQKQISARLRIPEGTVKSRMSTARARFRAAYPYPPNGGIHMQQTEKKTLPAFLPEYSIVWKDEPAFSVECEELTGWFIVPRIGETLLWGMYDLPSRKLDIAYDMAVTGPASVHGLSGVSIRASVLPREACLAEDDPMRDAVEASCGGHEEWQFTAQEKDGYPRFLSAEHIDHGVRTLTTFLDGDAFMDSWGFGEDNCGMPVRLEQRGTIRRDGSVVTSAPGSAPVDIVGRCGLTLGGVQYDTVCVMDLEAYDAGTVSEKYLNREGRTVLWRRFNRDDWAIDRYGKRWSELLPENERLTVNGRLYVHWYDCLCIR